VEQRAEQQQEKGKDAEKMRSMLGYEEKSGNAEERNQNEPCW
jgi:hypothetical protein